MTMTSATCEAGEVGVWFPWWVLWHSQHQKQVMIGQSFKKELVIEDI